MPATIPADVPCLEQCVPQGMLWPVLIAAVLQNNNLTLDTNTLMNNARCIGDCVPRGMQLPVLIWLTATVNAQSTDPNTLMNNARCVDSCIPIGAQLPTLIALTEQTVTPPEVPIRFYYWTLEEGSGNFVDEVHAVEIDDAFQNPGNGSGNVIGDRVPGLFGNGVRLYWKGPGGGALGNFQMTVGDTNANTADLALPATVNGFSMACWLKVDSLGTSYGSVGYVSTGSLSMMLNFAAGIGFYFRWTDTSHTEDLTVTSPTLGTWFFLHLFYDATQTRFGYSIDNGAEILGTYAPTLVPSVKGGVFAWQLGLTTPNDYTVDEIALRLDTRFTPTEVTYLYNSGAGRTWPVTMP